MSRLLTIIILLPFIASGQGMNNIWLSGIGGTGASFAGVSMIDFDSGIPMISAYNPDMTIRHTAANISDTSGNLLFYTNGIYIADATSDTMQNGNGINPGPYLSIAPGGLEITQAALIIKAPGSDSLYYLFHNTIDSLGINIHFGFYLYMTVIDMSQNGGLGAVVQKNIVLISDTINPGKITATRHANGRDWWIICHQANTNMFYKLLVTPYGLPAVSSQYIGSNRINDSGQANFSPNGLWYGYFAKGVFDIFNFDRCSGNFYNYRSDSTLGNQGIFWSEGCAFSPYSDMVYVFNAYQAYQYNLGIGNLITSRTFLGLYDGFCDSLPGNCIQTLFGQAQLASDGKIYINTVEPNRYFHIVHFPYFPGIACNFLQHDFMIPTYNTGAITNHPNYFLNQLSGSPCDSLTNLHEPEHDFKLAISPNPAPGRTKIIYQLPQNQDGRLEIFEIFGAKVYEGILPPWSNFKLIDLTFLKNGFYNCVIKSGDLKANIKLVIIQNGN